ncbi:MAG: SUF system NifU family Fe-S cluster assembly protein [Planctomycetales bacterium]
MLEELTAELYNDTIRDHAECSDYRGCIPDAPHRAEAFNRTCGDQVCLDVVVDEDGNIENLKFSGKGCLISQASCSMMAEALEGLSVEQADSLLADFRSLIRGKFNGDREALGDLAVMEAVSRSPVRVKCAALSWTALEDVLKDYQDSLAAK